MDIDLEKKIKDTIEQLKQLSDEDIDYSLMDPIAKMMLVALIGEERKILDYVNYSEQRIFERYASAFIPYEKENAIPAIALLNPEFRKVQKDFGIVNVGNGASFSVKNAAGKMTLNFIPLFNTSLISNTDLYVLKHNTLSYSQGTLSLKTGEAPNRVWIGITTHTEIECLRGVSLFIKGTNGILPEYISAGVDDKRLSFSTMNEFEDIEMAEPFDAQQSSEKFFSFIHEWKEHLTNIDDAALMYITDDTIDRDLFKPRIYPKIFLKWLENEILDCFVANTLWLRLDFPEGYTVPDSFSVMLNVFPVVNVDVNSVTLTPSTPIAKLQKQENSFFIGVLETSTNSSRQGYSKVDEEIIIRDFDASCYNNDDLYRDVRNLYNRFVDDYHAFVEYNGIRDGEVLKQLRETINKTGKSVSGKTVKNTFDSGTYAMKIMNQDALTTSTKVSFMTTYGRMGNDLLENKMETRRLPALETKIPIVMGPVGGTDKSTVDDRYEQLRYYSLTNDRLYTKMDIDAFLRKEIMVKFGKEEFNRIFIKMNVEGIGGLHSLQRGLYIDIEFKDRKNYDKACKLSFDKLMKQKIDGKSCISMPIIINLINLEKNG